MSFWAGRCSVDAVTSILCDMWQCAIRVFYLAQSSCPGGSGGSQLDWRRLAWLMEMSGLANRSEGLANRSEGFREAGWPMPCR